MLKRFAAGAGLLAAIALYTPAACFAGDSDHDGVEDARDRCPHTAQIPKAPENSKYAAVYLPERRSGRPMSYPVDQNGCEPDRDRDGVKDSADFCPDDTPQSLSAGVAHNGCPRQSDGDGTPDYRDHCPGTPRGVRADRFGCPE